MPDLKQELALRVMDLQDSSDATRRKLGLLPNEFAWFNAEVWHLMEPRPIVPGSNLMHTYYTSEVTYFGGITANKGYSKFSHIDARIAEGLEGGRTHQAGPHSLPNPWIPRSLMLLEDVVVVDTPMMTFTPIDGPMLIEDTGRYRRYHQITRYHIPSKVVAVESGKRGVGPYPYPIYEENISHLPTAIAENRLEVMMRTIKRAAAIFQQVSSGDITAHVQREIPAYD